MIYDDQIQQPLANMASQDGQSQSLGGYGTTQEIQSYEQMIRLLPTLPLNAEERQKICAVIQGHFQRKSRVITVPVPTPKGW